MINLTFPNFIRLAVGLIFIWIGIYLVSNNLRSKIGWIIFLFLFSLGWYILFVDIIIPFFTTVKSSIILDQLTDWSYILPIPLLLHFVLIATHRIADWRYRFQLYLIYVLTIVLIVLSIVSNFVINRGLIVHYETSYGFLFARGPLFDSIGVLAFLAMSLAFWSCVRAFQERKTFNDTMKYGLLGLTCLSYVAIAPFLVLVYQSQSYDLAVNSTSPLLLGPIIFLFIAIFKFRLVSDIEDIFNRKEFYYLTFTMMIISSLYAYFLSSFRDLLGSVWYTLLVGGLILVLVTHGFYDWLATFIRDLIYNASQGFSLITDSDVIDIVRYFHAPKKLETNSLLKFKIVKDTADENRLIDAAQAIVRKAIDYFKQTDYPRRTKQNLKYQLLKMLTIDEAEEGQILWELGFEGYPMKIMGGENHTRKPLFKVEAMSDYIAVSRNAFIALKKEAIHDLAWRLSYLERSKK